MSHGKAAELASGRNKQGRLTHLPNFEFEFDSEEVETVVEPASRREDELGPLVGVALGGRHPHPVAAAAVDRNQALVLAQHGAALHTMTAMMREGASRTRAEHGTSFARPRQAVSTIG